MWFDGTANGLTTTNTATAEQRDIDAFSIPAATVTPPPPPPPGPTGDGNGKVVFSTRGNANPTGVAGTADDADLYSFDGTSTTRELDVTALPVASRLPASANLDAYDRVDADALLRLVRRQHDRAGAGRRPGRGRRLLRQRHLVDVVRRHSHGLTAAAQDIDAISVSGATLYFSTAGNTNPPRVTGGRPTTPTSTR